MQHHAFAIEAEVEEGITFAQAWVEKGLGMKAKNNPDIVVLRYGLLSVEDARQVSELAAGKAFVSEYKVVIIAASRAYHEAQNALLKVFEEPPAGTYLFLIMPSLGGLLPTLRSRVQIFDMQTSDMRCPTFAVGHRMSDMSDVPEIAEQFLKATKEKRSAMIRGSQAERRGERRENRDEAIALVNGIEAAVYSDGSQAAFKYAELLSDIAVLRGHLYDRSAPVKMILEHLSLVIPKDLV